MTATPPDSPVEQPPLEIPAETPPLEIPAPAPAPPAPPAPPAAPRQLKRRGRKPVDRTGQRFGRLVALEYVGVRWVCRCDCGKVGAYATHNLAYGLTRSCGCIRDENIAVLGAQAKANRAAERARVQAAGAAAPPPPPEAVEQTAPDADNG